jgi:hypothetical protein
MTEPTTDRKCDCHARRWHRDGPLWQGSGWRGEVYRWPGLLAYHPHLTDATETGADQ